MPQTIFLCRLFPATMTLRLLKSPSSYLSFSNYSRFFYKTNAHAEIIRWSDRGDSFVIADVERFAPLLATLIKSRNYYSFVRQLNLYQFRKVRLRTKTPQYQHQLFRQGDESNLRKIRRRVNSDKISKPRKSKPQSNRIHLREEVVRLSLRISEMRQTHEEMSKQKERLIKSNNDHYTEIFNLKNFGLIKFQKLFFVFLSTIYGKSAELIERIFRLSSKPKVDSNGSRLTITDVLERLKTTGFEFCKEVIGQRSPDTPLLDVVVQLAYKSLTRQDPPLQPPSIMGQLLQFTNAIRYDDLVQNLKHNVDLAKLKELIAASFSRIETAIRSLFPVEHFAANQPGDMSIDSLSLNLSTPRYYNDLNDVNELRIDDEDEKI
jgi:hypothetical protein